jgi:hypothetical protein
MDSKGVCRLSAVLVMIAASVLATACNTTKATTDTTVKFFSSTSPGELFTEDGLIAEDQKVNFFVGVGFENLRQDIAKGQGEYLVSLERLLRISPSHHAEFADFAQQNFHTLFTSDLSSDRSAHLTTVANLKQALVADGRLAKWRTE